MVLESAKSQVDRICKEILEETLDPAKQQAKEIRDAANKESEVIIEKAQVKAKQLIASAETVIKEKELAYKASVEISTSNALESLRQKMVNQFFKPALRDLLHQSLTSVDVAAKIIEAVIEASQDGIESEMKVYLAQSISAEDVRKTLTSTVLEKLKTGISNKSELADGIRIVSEKGEFALDFTVESLAKFVEKFAFDDLKDMLFNK